jgi:hypothetical protein
MPGGVETGYVSDLSDEDRRGDRPDTVDGLDRPVTVMVLELAVQMALDHGEFPVEDLDQVPQGLDSQPLRSREVHLMESFLALPGEHIWKGRQDP